MRAVNDHDEPVSEAHCDTGQMSMPPYPMTPYWTCYALVEGRGRVAAADSLGANYRTLANCCDIWRVSRRVLWALVDRRDADSVSRIGAGVASLSSWPAV